ncbi:MAG: ABC transporter permease, partial [Gallionella sp.]|nr:ABC transporter permease [Gallionella sp.]
MNFLPVILWSDALVFLLVAAAGVMAWHVRRHEHLLLPWRRVAQSGMAMVSLLVLSLFLLVGGLDTLHYRVALPHSNGSEAVYSPEVLSVLDKLAGPLRQHAEKTYSAPLALALYAKESFTDAQGRLVRDYPRLQYGGAHLADASQRDGDVIHRALAGALAGVLVCALLLAALHLVARGLGLGIPQSGTKEFAARRAVSIAALLLAALIGATFNLASVYLVLGTDKVGQDVLYLSLKSIRTGLVI